MTTSSISIENDLIKDSETRPPTLIILAMFGLLLVSYMVNAMERPVFPLLASDIRKEFGFTVADTGLIATFFTLGMAIAGWPAAYFITRFSRKGVVQAGILIFSIGTGLTALSHGFFDILFYRMMTGIGEALQQIAIVSIATSYFARSRALAIATMQVAFAAGNMGGPLLASSFVGAFGSWRGPFYSVALGGFAMVALVAVFVRKSFSETRKKTAKTKIVGGSDRLFNSNTIILSVITVLIGPILYGHLGLYPTFLREQIQLPPQDVAIVMSLFGFGALLAPVAGWLGDKLEPRLMLGWGFILLAILGYLIYDWGTSFITHCMLSFMWGFSANGIIYTNLWGAHIKSVNADLGPKASGLFITLLYTTSAFGGLLMGKLVGLSSWGTAAIVQLTGLAIICAFLSMFLQSSRMSTVIQSKSEEQ